MSIVLKERLFFTIWYSMLFLPVYFRPGLLLIKFEFNNLLNLVMFKKMKQTFFANFINMIYVFL